MVNLTPVGLGLALAIALPAWSSAQRPGKPVIDREPVEQKGNPTAAPKAAPTPATSAETPEAGQQPQPAAAAPALLAAQPARGACSLQLNLTSGTGMVLAIPLWQYIQMPVGQYNLAQVKNLGGYYVNITVESQEQGPSYIENLPDGQSRQFSGAKRLWFARCHDNNACYLEYERADNGWAGAGRPDGNLGKEYVLVPAGETKTFNTDWKYEAKRGDGTTYYGSHLRKASNQGIRPIEVLLRTSPISESRQTLKSGSPTSFRADLMKVSCT